MRNMMFTSVLLAVPLAAGAYAPETEYEDPQLQEEQAQDQRAQDETMGQEFEETGAEMGQETEQQFEEASQETEQQLEETGQATEQQFEETSSELEQETDAQFEETGMQDQQAGGGEPEIERSQFTSEVRDREPVDEVSDEFQAAEDPLFFFTEVKDGAGETITHRWKLDDEVMAEVPLEVGSDGWRTWSSKELTPEMEGEWTVEVVDSQGNVLEEKSVNVDASGAQQQNVGYSEDQQQQDQQQQDQQAQEADWQDAASQEQDTATQDEAAVQEEDWQDVEFEEDVETQEDPMFEESSEEQQDDQATEDQEDW